MASTNRAPQKQTFNAPALDAKLLKVVERHDGNRFAFIVVNGNGHTAVRQVRPVREQLIREVNVSIADPKLQARLADLDGTALGGSPADFAKLISDEFKKWSRVVETPGTCQGDKQGGRCAHVRFGGRLDRQLRT